MTVTAPTVVAPTVSVPSGMPKPPGSFGDASAPGSAQGPASPSDPSKAPLSPGAFADGPKPPGAGSAGSMPASPETLAAKSAAVQAEKDKEKAAEPTLDFKEPPPKTIGAGFEKRELRKLSPEEKAVLRLKTNIVMAIMGAMILTVALFILTRL